LPPKQIKAPYQERHDGRCRSYGAWGRFWRANYKDAAPLALGLGAKKSIPKGFRHSAQRCRDEGGVTLGGKSK